VLSAATRMAQQTNRRNGFSAYVAPTPVSTGRSTSQRNILTRTDPKPLRSGLTDWKSWGCATSTWIVGQLGN
jgi:hypothetical protein